MQFLPKATKYFQDFVIGEKLDHGAVLVTPQRHRHYWELTKDQNQAYAPPSGKTVHPLFLFHTVFGLSVHDISYNAQANLEYARLRFLKPLQEGEMVHAFSEITGKQGKGPQRGIVYVRTWGQNGSGERVLEYQRWVMVYQDAGRVPDQHESIPAISRELSLDELHIPAARPAPANTLATLAHGTRYLHPEEQEIDIILATQIPVMTMNNAKVHFQDDHLVYGGAIISAAFSRLSRALPWHLHLGWNTGRHTAPTYPGQKVKAGYEVLGTWQAKDRPGLEVVRLRLFAERPVAEKERDKFKGDTVEVLTLDNFIAVPTKRM
ncbi:MAG: hypothetical protein HYX97_07420 [Chloroflexi bacterium]|nr:hypothetical protein [Chloroflexota bacterium]